MTVLVWVLIVVGMAIGLALRAWAAHRRMHAAETLAAQWEWIAGRAQADRDHLAWELGQSKRLLSVAERDRDACRYLAVRYYREAVHARTEARQHTCLPVVVGTVAVDGEAAYQAAVEGIDRLLSEAGVAE